MEATSTRLRQGTIPPVVAARWALWTFVVVNVVIVEVLFLTAGTGKNGVLTVAKFFGLHAAVLMLFQLLLVARLPWLDRRIGMDRLTGWHRWVGFSLLWTLLTHAVLVVLGYARLDDASMAKTFFALAGVPASLLGMLAAAIVVVVAAVSARQVRRRLRYETWHGVHLLLYVALGLAFVHQLEETTTFSSSAFAMVYWWALWLFAFGALVTGRIVMPLWRNAYHRFEVVAVVPESDDVVSVHVTGRHLDRLPARAGQFCIWRFPGHNHWWLANPFSLSAAPDGRTLRLTAKAVGSTSAGLRHVPVGSRAFVEGPYGAFTSLHRTRPGALLIAGEWGSRRCGPCWRRNRTVATSSCSTGCAARTTPCWSTRYAPWSRSAVGSCTCSPAEGGGQIAVRAGESPCPGSRHRRTRRVRLWAARDDLDRARLPARAEGSPPAGARRAVRSGLTYLRLRWACPSEPRRRFHVSDMAAADRGRSRANSMSGPWWKISSAC